LQKRKRGEKKGPLPIRAKGQKKKKSVFPEEIGIAYRGGKGKPPPHVRTRRRENREKKGKEKSIDHRLKGEGERGKRTKSFLLPVMARKGEKTEKKKGGETQSGDLVGRKKGRDQKTERKKGGGGGAGGEEKEKRRNRQGVRILFSRKKDKGEVSMPGRGKGREKVVCSGGGGRRILVFYSRRKKEEEKKGKIFRKT